MNPGIPLIVVLAAGLLALLGGMAWLCHALARLRRRLAHSEAALAALAEETRALLECSRGLGERVRQQTARLDELGRRQDLVELGEGAPAASRVLQLLEQGYRVEDIARICDLNPTEIDLISAVARYRPAA